MSSKKGKRKGKQKFTKNQLEFRKQQKRLINFIKRKEKIGFRFDREIVPEMPKRVTKKQLERIRNIKPRNLYENSTFYDDENDEIISGLSALELIRDKANSDDNIQSIQSGIDEANKMIEEIHQKNEEQINENKKLYQPDTNIESNSQYKKGLDKVNSRNNIYNEVISLIEEQIPNYSYIKGGIKYDLRTHKNRLITLWQNVMEKFINPKTGEFDENNELYNYINSQWGVLEEATIGVYRSSQQEEIEQHISEILRVLSYDTPISLEDSIMIDDLAEHL